jgi:hypothetical protein
MPSTHRKSTKKFLLVTIVSAILSISSGVVYACIDHIGPLSGGANAFVSCGSSAGNYAFVCEADNNCYEDTDPQVQADANSYCASPQSCLNREQPEQPPQH